MREDETMPKPPKAQTGRSIEAGRRALDAASTPREIRKVERMAELARKWAKEQDDALDKQIAWGELRFDALRKLGKILGPLLTRHRPRKGYKGFRLRDEGISRDLSSLAQRVYGVSETLYRRYIDDAKRQRREITQKDFFEKVAAVKRSQHFTGRGEAKRLFELTQRVIAEHGIKFDWWLEPSAGDGAFYDLLPAHMRLGIDIDSHRSDIVQADFLTFDGFAPGVTYAAIGNPPWVENGVVEFFKRCADHCSVIAFLVPRSFLRPQAINRLDPRFRLLYQEVSPRGQPPVFATVFQIWVRDDELREPIETASEHPDFEFLPRDRPDVREKADIVIRRIGVDAGNILNPSEVTRADRAHWIKCRPGVDVEKVRARLRAIDWTDPKYIDTAAEGHGTRGYRSLSMSAVVDEYERCKTQALTDIWHQDPEKVADWMIAADREKAAELWRALGEQLGLSDQRKKQEGYLRIENQAQPDDPETRYNLAIIDKTAGWDTWHGKLAWLDGLSFEDKLREGPALLSNFDDWLDQVQGITPAWKKHVVPS
jgi:hypothetical protein